MLLTARPPFDGEQQHDVAKDGDVLAQGIIARHIRREMQEVVPSLRDALGAEDDPSDDHQHECPRHLPGLAPRGIPSVGRHDVQVFAVLFQQDERQEEHGMIRAPDDERPVRTMPQATGQEDGKRIAHLLPLPLAAAAQRDVQVIDEPRVERDVPAAPELGDVAAEVRHIEVALQRDAEQLGRADCDVRIAREVAVDLERERHAAQQEHHAALVLVSVKDEVGKRGAIVGHDELLEQAPQHLPHSVGRLLIPERARALKLRQEVRGPLDGAGHQLREETDVGGKLDQVARGPQLAAIDVDGIRQRLKRIERDTHRENQPQHDAAQVDAQQFAQLRGEEVVVFVRSEDAQI